MAGGNFGGGTGMELDPYLVEDADDLNAVRNDLAASYKQTADIDLSGYANWEPIGNISDLDYDPWVIFAPFTGSYDGSGYTVNNLQRVDPREPTSTVFDECSGLFGFYNGATFSNIGILNADVTAYTNGGTLAGGGPGGIFNKCYATGTVNDKDLSGNYFFGGLVGSPSGGEFNNCYAIVNVKGARVGGLVGFWRNTDFTNCFSAGSVTQTGDYPAYKGGLIGEVDTVGTLTACYYDSETSGQNDTGKGIPKTTTQMRQQATFSGWDFTDTWNIDEGISYPYLIFAPDIALTSPVLLVTDIRSANPTIKFKINKQENIPYLGPKLHCRVEAFADEAMTVLLDDRISNIVDSAHPVFEYSFNDAMWFDVAPTGIDPTQYGNFDMYVRAIAYVGPRQQAYIRCSIGIDS